MAEPPSRVLELRPAGHWDSKLFKLKTGWVLRFTLAPCLYATDIKLYTDYPAPGTLYKRGVMRELQWQYSTRQLTWDPDRHINITLDSAGPYRFQYKRKDAKEGEVIEGSGYFLVEPDLGYSPEGIACQTYITKLLGPLTEWKERLQMAKEAGYNMIHFTPINQLGSSRSAYSISNQLRIDPSYLPAGYTPTESKVTFKNCEGVTKSLTVEASFTKVHDLVKSINRDWGVLSLGDVVWNHTAFDTPWLLQHPEAGYNLINSPHLRPSYALDLALANFSREIAEGQWEKFGIRPEIHSENDIGNICTRLRETVLPRAQLWQYFCVDVEAAVEEFRSTVYRLNGGNHPRPQDKWLTVIQDPQYRRLGSGVDIDLTLELFNVDWPGMVCFEERIERCSTDLRETLRFLNQDIIDRVGRRLESAIANLAANIRYQYLEAHGPRKQKITKEDPLFPRYFHMVGGGMDLAPGEIEGTRGEYVLAHNGWVMNADPLVNFAAEGSEVYFKRELIVWGDSIKLRYGSKPEDSPWLWEHMKQYTQTMAWIFDGFRLDNCHNTPINVAEGLLDAAREVNPNLYLVAELFTPSEENDNYFVNRLGINSLVREAMFASYARELGRLVFKYGGEPVASFMPPPTHHVLKPTVTNAMFMDATHDNDPGHILSRSVYDALPNTALMAICSCASGGTRGYDELVPHMINVVTEGRPYAKWSDSSASPGAVSENTGIVQAKSELNKLHIQLAEQGFNQIYVDQVTEEIVAVTRHSPKIHESVILMAHTAFHPPEYWATPTEDRPHTHWSHVPPLTVPGQVEEVILEARLVKKSPDPPQFEKDQDVINGLQDHVLDMRAHIQLEDSQFCRLNTGSNGNTQEVVFSEFAPGSIIALRVSLVPEATSAIQIIRSFLSSSNESPEGYLIKQRVEKACSSLNLYDLNYALYRCDAEEQDDGEGGGVYEVPGAGKLVYCGLQGIMSMLTWVRDNNDLGHPLCCNLRDGDWMASYTANRLKLRTGTKSLGELLSELFHQLSLIPRYLIPCYFDAIVSAVHSQLLRSAIAKMGKFVQEGSSLVQGLALGSVQLVGECRSAILPASSPIDTPSASLAAGLPHFATGFMRCWGRDTFIALRGLLLVTNRHEEARNNLLSFGACLRHGLIPNLLNDGANPRYNCRDAPWWWLQSIQDYCTMAPNGHKILQAEVKKLYRDEDAPADFDSTEAYPLTEIIQEVLSSHMLGIKFRERGAGPNLDRSMTPPGFNVEAGVDKATGFVYGGNVHNCGTWMDKVGESSWSGNKGVPATPRDGSAVELVGLCYSTVSWLGKLFSQGIYPYSGVQLPTEEGALPSKFTFQDWAKTIKANFENQFWIPEDLEQAQQREGDNRGFIYRRGIFKDSVGASQRYSDYRLRPNYPIAMVVAPDLFTPGNAWAALGKAEEILLGPLGMKTLDPHDYVYNGYYVNSVDSGDFNSARGFNYHQGPEWLWVIGYFLRARLHFARRNGLLLEDTISFIHKVLSAHAQALHDSPWKGLPELTNKDGSECPDSCPVQAWSMATLLDVLHDLEQYSS